MTGTFDPLFDSAPDVAAPVVDLLRAKIEAVEAVLAKARLVSPSPSMSVYVTDIERALGHDRPVAHKKGAMG